MTREEAINRIKNMLLFSEDREALETLIPELCENEDERIKKIITDSVFYQYGAGVEYKNALDYLDKLELQKKKKDFRKLYEDIAKSEWFKKAYEGKSLGRDHEQMAEECEYDKETSTQKAYREGQTAGRQEVFDHPGAYGLEKIDNVFGFRIGDRVRLVDGDGRPHIIKYFEKIEGLHGPDFYRAIFEDNTASDHIIPGDEYPNGYFTCMQKIDEQKEQRQNPLIRMMEDKKAITEDIRKGIPTKTIEKKRNVKFATPVDVSHIEWSKDEMHRKWILEYLYDGLRKADEQFKDQFKSAIDWLENQKEEEGYDVIPVESTLEYKLGFKAGKNDAEKEINAQLTHWQEKAYDEMMKERFPDYDIKVTTNDSVSELKSSGDIYENIHNAMEPMESDDEKIRRALIEVAHDVAQEQFFINRGTTLKDVLAYLENQKPLFRQIHDGIIWDSGLKTGIELGKQKEQPPYWNPTEEDVALFNKAVTTNKSLSPQDRAKLDIIRMKFKHCPYIEQKPEHPLTPDECINPAEWSDEDEENFKWFDKFFRAESVIAEGRDIPQDKYLWFKSLRPQPNTVPVENQSVDSLFAKWSEKCGIEECGLYSTERKIEPEPKVEWSEEDEKIRNLAIEWAETMSDQLNFVDMDPTDFRKITTWLKSLPISLKKNKDVAKLCSNEWSEEDEKILHGIEQCIYNNVANIGTVNKVKYIDFLKSLRSSWKPSEHQMTILKAVKDYVGVGSGYLGEALGSLIEDLEKL